MELGFYIIKIDLRFIYSASHNQSHRLSWRRKHPSSTVAASIAGLLWRILYGDSRQMFGEISAFYSVDCNRYPVDSILRRSTFWIAYK